MTLAIDEVGRGSLAGPLVVGAVCLNCHIGGLDDSKKLSPIIRKKLSEQILTKAKIAVLGWVWPEEIDKLGLTKSMRLAIKRALKDVELSRYSIIIDGNVNYLKHLPNSKAIIKADQKVSEVSAASIIAKVARDEYMTMLSSSYPQYKLASNVGYGTRDHFAAIRDFGLSKIHRLSYKLNEKALNSS